MENKKRDRFYIISEKDVLFGPTHWSGSLVDVARWYRNVALKDNVKIVEVVVDEKAL